MFQKLILFTLCVVGFTSLKAQTPACTPNKLYQDSAAGVYPLPRTTARPNAGISQAACLSTAYNFVFTVKADSISTTLGTVKVDSITIATTGAIQGLPGGLTYACNPPTCGFKYKVLGCVVLLGTVASTDTIKDYPLVITAKAYIYPFTTTQSFPSATFPGDYTVTVLPKGSPKCLTPTDNIQQFVSGVKILPNPANDAVHVSMNVQEAGEYSLRVVNLVGVTIVQNNINLSNGVNEISLNVSNLNNGLYFYSLSKDNQTISEKFVVSR